MPRTKGVDVLERYREQCCDELILCMHRCIKKNSLRKTRIKNQNVHNIREKKNDS